MMSKATESEEVWDAQFITETDESAPKTVRYNDVAYQRKLARQAAEEHQAQPITQRGQAAQ